MSKNPSRPASAKQQRRQIAGWKKLLFATLVCLVFFSLVEFTLWAFDVATVIEQEDPFRGFSGLVTVFEAQGDAYQTRRSNLDTFNDQSFLAEKPDNGFRIFCLGGSSAHGFPWGAEAAFTGIVGEALAASHRELQVEAINAGGVSYAMHRLNIVADELLAYQPDVFVIYSGHNEFVEPASFELLKGRNTARTRLEYLFSHSRLYSSMRATFQHFSAEEPATGHDFDLTLRRDETRVFSAEEKEAIVAEFRGRLERLVRRAQTAGVKVVLATVPANLRQWHPEASTGVATLNEVDRQKWSEAFGVGWRQLKSGEFAAAIASLEQAVRLAPRHAETQYLLAQAYEGLARWDDARAAYRRASDSDASPVRRVSGINEAIRRVAKEQGAVLVDADQIFEQRSEHGLVGFNLIEDFVHPNREGHEMIAWHIWDAMEMAGWFGSQTPARRSVFDNLIRSRRRRPVTNNTNAVWLYNQGVVLGKQGNVNEAIEKFRHALVVDPGYTKAMLNLGVLLSQSGKYPEAAGVLRRYIELVPNSAEAHTNLGYSLQGLGRLEEAVAHCQEAVRIKPDYAEAHTNLGNCLQSLGRSEEAVSHYQEALRIKPNLAEVHYNWGLILEKSERFEEAVVHYREALRIRPDFAEAHNNWGVVLARQGRLQEASRHFQHAVRLKPDYRDAHDNLRRSQTLLQQKNSPAQP